MFAVSFLSILCLFPFSNGLDLSAPEYDKLLELKSKVIEQMKVGDEQTINIKLLGAVGDGNHNDTEPFMTGMKLANTVLPGVPVLVPEGTFLMWPVVLPCKNVRVIIRGTVLVAPADSGWLQSEHFWRVDDAENCTITGQLNEYESHGVISGQGEQWWQRRDESAPSLIYFNGYVSTYPESGVYNISLNNAPGVHVSVRDTYFYGGPEITGVLMYSPQQSHNTIGVHAVNASFRLEASEISTSGPNVLVECPRGETSRAFAMCERSRFGFGQGLTFVMYDGIMGNISLFQNEFQGTTYGLRVLGAVDGTGWVSNIMLYDTTMVDVGIPLEVENTQCPLGRHDCTGTSQGVRLDYISAGQLTGFQTTGNAGRFNCRSDRPCFISLNDVTIKASGHTTQNRFICSNAQGYSDNTSPESCLEKPSL